jgi:capsular polysaccharide biosynthesis protein
VTAARTHAERSLRAALLASLSAFPALCAFFSVSGFYAASKLYFLLLAATMVAAGQTRAVRRPERVRLTGDPVTMGIESPPGIGSPPPTARQDHLLPGPKQPEDVERADVGHFLRVVMRWWVVILAGTIFIVGTAVALLRLTTPPFQAETVLVFDQPVSGGLNGQQGLAATQQIVSLLPTYARIATSDGVLTDAAGRAGVTASLDELRARVKAQPVPETLALRLTAEDANPKVADKLSAAVSRTFAKFLDDRQSAAGIAADRHVTVSPLTARGASREPRAETRTIILAALLGLTVTIALAFFLEYIRPREQLLP